MMVVRYVCVFSVVCACAPQCAKLEINKDSPFGDETGFIEYRGTNPNRMAHSSVPGLFDAKNERIEDYKERFDFYCVAHGVAEEKRKALFLTSIGQQMYVKLKTWIRPRTFSELTLAQIVAKLKERTMEETIEIAERYKFFKRVQQPRETVIEYMSGLKQLASTCNFLEYLDTALRDQLVCGIRDQGIQ